MANYDRLMRELDWSADGEEDIDALVSKLHSNIISHTDTCFPWKNYKVRSTDDPWVDDATRKKIGQRKAVFAWDKHRSKDWRELKAITNNMLKTREKGVL